MDAQFIDPAVAAVAGVNPASITNGAPTAAATTNPLADIMSLIAHFTTNNIPVDGLSFIMSPGNALSLSFRTTVSGDAMFPGITPEGGTYRGINFVTSNAAGTNVDRGAAGLCALCRRWRGDDRRQPRSLAADGLGAGLAGRCDHGLSCRCGRPTASASARSGSSPGTRSTRTR